MNRILGKAHRQRRTTEHSVSQSEPAAETAAERRVRPSNLAWALADAAKPHLNAAERSDVYISLGVGETFTAIKDLITSAAGKRIALPAEVVQRCHGWLDVHIGHEDEQHLRALVEQVLTPYAIRTTQLKD